ncbi:MAG: BC1872 family protein [Janthinobacterium lividum]
MNLTRQEIENMPAGPAINQLVAEKILGRIWVHTAKTNNLIDPDDWPVWQVAFNDIEVGKGDVGNPVGGAMGYSTDIARAWQVVEKMHADGWGYGLSAGRATIDPLPGHRLPDCTFYTRDGRQGWNQAETAPIAICRAALLALFAPTLPTAP